MDIFVLGKRAAQWLSEQLLGPRGTKAEPVAPRLWRGPGGVQCDDAQCQWQCVLNQAGSHEWQIVTACPNGCICPQPASVCDNTVLSSLLLTYCNYPTTTSETSTTGSTSTSDTTVSIPCEDVWCGRKSCIYQCALVDGTWKLALVANYCQPSHCCFCEREIIDISPSSRLYEVCRCDPSHKVELDCSSVCSHSCTWLCQGDRDTCTFEWVKIHDCVCPQHTCLPPVAPCNIHTYGEVWESKCTEFPSTTTTLPGACQWLCQFGIYTLANNTCGHVECCCTPPEQPCPPQVSYMLVQLPCNCPTPPPPPRCSDYCTWTCAWSEQAMADVWLLRENRCDAAAGCMCDPPSPITCSIPGEGTMTPCYRPDQTSSTTTTGSGTTTTAELCSQHLCKWKCINWDGRFFWQRIEHCPQGCLCNNDVMPPEEDCVCATVGQVRAFTCHPPTTTTTETTTTSVNCLAHFCDYYCAGGVWTLVSHDCPIGCDCVTPPSGPCPGRDGYYALACEPTTTTTLSSTTTTTSSTTTTTSSTTTTTTTPSCLQYGCRWSCHSNDDGYTWQWWLIEPCQPPCTCDPPPFPCSGTEYAGQVLHQPCYVASTTTTDTTTTSSTTTTDTTTSQDCTLWYCYASCQTDGQGNYYWDIFGPCPTGCQCRPDLYFMCHEWSVGWHIILCDY